MTEAADTSFDPITSGGLARANSRILSTRYHVFGAINMTLGICLAMVVVYLLCSVGYSFYDGQFENHPIMSLALFITLICTVGVIGVCLITLGVRLLMNKLRGAHLIAEIVCIGLAFCGLLELMLEGLSPVFWMYVVFALGLYTIFSLADPTLEEERRLQRVLRSMEDREDAEEGTLGRDETGQGYIALNFFNIFWIFVIGALIGDIVETVYHYMIEVPGEFQIRAGLLWGPFSPIYGFGAVLLTMILNRFYKANGLIIFLVSAVVGGAFEYLVSWFLEFAFGAVAWDYTGRFLNIGGRTDFMFMCMWGALGLVWIKLILPKLLQIVNLIPWKWRYTITSVCAALMIFDGAMTLMALDCWYIRLDGSTSPDLAVTDFFADHFPNDYMAARFQSMSIDPSLTTRVS